MIGAGNVAWHLATALALQTDIVSVYSHTDAHAQALATHIGRPESAISCLSEIPADCDYYIVSIKDDAIADVAKHTPDAGIWAHTSGSVPMSVFDGVKSRYGVFYPLQTFSRDVTLDISHVLFFIEGSTTSVTTALSNLASLISDCVEPADSHRRRALHVAAVFACNFANYMWVHADTLLRREGLNLSVMQPLLAETLDKITRVSPHAAQTGPARRGDIHTIEKHLEMLDDNDSKAIYRLLSDSILKHYNNEQD